MSNIHTRTRAREHAAAYMAGEWPGCDQFSTDALIDAFVAGAMWAITPQSQDDVNQIVAGVIRDAQAAGTDEAADDASQAIFAYLGAKHREEQDLWCERFVVAEALISKASALFRSYEAQHRDKAEKPLLGEPIENFDDRKRDTLAKADRNAEIAASLEAWLAPLRENPVEVLRQIGKAMVDGETVKGVDHDSFDQAAAVMARPVPWRQEGVADLVAVRLITGDPRFDPAKPANINGYLFVPAKED